MFWHRTGGLILHLPRSDGSILRRKVVTPAGRAMAGLLSVFAEFERDIMRERVRAGLAHARLQGKRLGRPPTAAGNAGSVRDLFLAGISKSEIARRLGIGRTSIRRLLEQENS